MRPIIQFYMLILLFSGLFSCKTDDVVVKPQYEISDYARQFISGMGRGMDVDWSKTAGGMDNYNTQTVVDFKKRGLGHVRIRIADDISNSLLTGLDQQINDCLTNGLIPVVAYQANDFKLSPTDANLAKVVQWWTAVAERYKSYSNKLAFDIIIEVSDVLTDHPDMLNKVYEQVVTAIRKTNPERIIFISPRYFSSSQFLSELIIPSQHNGYLLAEWHMYAAGPSKTNAKKLWTTGTAAEKKIIDINIQLAVDWSKKTGIPTWVGAWMPGDYNDGNNYSVAEQVVFSRYMSCQLDKAGIPFSVNSDTKFYDRSNNSWISTMAPVMDEILNPQCP